MVGYHDHNKRVIVYQLNGIYLTAQQKRECNLVCWLAALRRKAGTRKNAAASSVLIATSAKEARQTLRRRRKRKMTFPFLLQSTLSEKMVSFYFYLNPASKSRRQWRPIWLWTWQTGRQCISGISNKAEQTTRKKKKKRDIRRVKTTTKYEDSILDILCVCSSLASDNEPQRTEGTKHKYKSALQINWSELHKQPKVSGACKLKQPFLMTTLLLDLIHLKLDIFWDKGIRFAILWI